MENSESTVLLNIQLPKAKMGTTYSSACYTDGYCNSRFAEQYYAGSLTGTYKGSIEHNEEVVVYAYRKGQFSADSEIARADDIKFKKAVASTLVDKGRTESSYRINFLEEGEFEVHFVAYQEDQHTGSLILQAELDVHCESEMNVSDIKVKAGTNSTLNVRRKEI